VREKDNRPVDPRGYGHAVLSAFWSAVMIVVSKWVMADIDPVSLAALIMTIGAASIAIWTTSRGGWRCMATLGGAGWKWTFGLSAFFFFVILGSLVAIQMMDPTVVAFVSRTETLVAVLLGVWFFGERFTRVEAIGGAFVLAGIVVIRYSGGLEVESGFWIALASAVGFGFAEATAKKTVSIVDPYAFALVRNLFLGAAFTAVAVSTSGFRTPSEPLGWIAVAGVGVSGPFLGRVHFLKALQMIHISKTALVNQALPVWVALLSFLLLRTVPSTREWLGGAVVVAGCVLLILGRTSQPRAADGPAAARPGM